MGIQPLVPLGRQAADEVAYAPVEYFHRQHEQDQGQVHHGKPRR
jgi:hypothetical protein